MARTSEPPIRCSFCGKRESQAGRLIAGPGVYICSDCVKACSDLLAEEMAAKKSGIPKLDSLPTPTMEGYTFNGWFTDIVDGSAIVAGETVFSGEEATVYAQWSPIDQVPTEPTAPADTVAGVLERHKGTILIVGGMLVLVAVGLAM